MNTISDTDLILNADGSLYHLNLLPGDIAQTVILVGDQDRVAEVSRHFDSIELKKGKREFITHTGHMGNKRLSVVSTGIGTDNIDIVLNELDALVNIDLHTRTVNPELKQLNFIRIGTSGTVQADIPVDSLLVSESAIGMDALMHFYKHKLTDDEQALLNAFNYTLPNDFSLKPYITSASDELLSKLSENLPKGITITAPGFYAPQGRQVRAQSVIPQLLDIIEKFEFDGKRITNLEMETAGIYSMAKALGHKAISFNVLLANRIKNNFSRQPAEIMQRFIVEVLDRIAAM
ncbi:nucleoside phosphorylase [Mucilaginibacter sp. KACC 22063]|uniref:nucleoside phosphorylase n=1 Tax=Mucilaginibacter sp. KACC 22063 TaxID=3025666 RepID=UPI002365F5DC|nr:nucleoside phosphorylase [Mucilaginibacter sp. KACC 22063]WDF56592.1 nucleoside phosphorylase [Mucilaginibacter sp. KACC 22063]